MHILKQYTVTELRSEQAKIFDRLPIEPIVLTRQGKPAAVLVDPEKWNELMDRLEDLQDSVDGLEVLLAMAQGEVEPIPYVSEEVLAEHEPVSG
jgi:PHD/YefM family antitoxin component YafN of YafNO toxin-antitoxin module